MTYIELTDSTSENCAHTCPIAAEVFSGETNDDRRRKLAVIAVLSGKATQTHASEEWHVPQATISNDVRDALAQDDQVDRAANLITPEAPLVRPPKAKGKDGKARPVINYSESQKADAVSRVLAGETQRGVSTSIGCSQSVLSGWVKKAKQTAPPTASVAAAIPPAVLPELSVKIIAAEKKLAKPREEALVGLVSLAGQLIQQRDKAQSQFKKSGRSVIRTYKELADERLVAEGVLKAQCQSLGLPADSTYEQMLRKIDEVAKSVSLEARNLLYFYGNTMVPEA